VLAVSGLLAAMTWLPVPSPDSPSASPAPVSTAPTSTAPTPSVEADRLGLLAPRDRPAAATGRAGCENGTGLVLRVLQFNIRFAMDDRGDVDVPRIAAEIKAVRPDLVSVNEVDSETHRTRVDEPAALAEATGLHVVYGPNLIYDGGPFGNAVLTRYPVVDSRNLRLPVTPGLEPRGLLSVVVNVRGRRVAFTSTHLSEREAGRRSRLLQALTVARALRATKAPAILAGDLNSVPGDVPARILRRDLLDAQEEGGEGSGSTWPQADPSSRLDYILYDRRLTVVPGSTRVRASGSSDHRSVFTELSLLPHPGCY
jgi:endonuclease/exonuclease/phosphatase family metal-dependent hydrolase